MTDGEGKEGTPMETSSSAVEASGSGGASELSSAREGPEKISTETAGERKTVASSSATSGIGVGHLQLPPSEGNVSTASAAGLAAAAVKAKVRKGRQGERE